MMRSTSNSCTASTSTMRPPTSSNGYTETLAYQELSASNYVRDPPPQVHDGRTTEGGEFISWVENNQPYNRPPQSSTPTSCHDTESLKSEKKRFSLFGKRGSKSQK
ncbi:hypothetical protein KIN20_036089 [Parelaphostrongylus tenuis]|uniref:Uncharacterized protein n=1 Tax=Parelaphostrongylus tenuis TaxID=148309 RepID=A0AAD5WKY6_PARTN|nr:hypothetical protein KIN20_036089 [Parelaphostrongylus tenuis]